MFLLFEQIFMVISHLFGFLHRAHNKYSTVQHTPLCKKEGMGKTGYPLFLLAFYSNFKHHNYVAKKQCQKRHKILQLTLKKWGFVILSPKHLNLHALEHEWSMIYLEQFSLSPKKLVLINITSCNIYHWPCPYICKSRLPKMAVIIFLDFILMLSPSFSLKELYRPNEWPCPSWNTPKYLAF